MWELLSFFILYLRKTCQRINRSKINPRILVNYYRLQLVNKIEIRERLNLTLSFDYDIIDGAPAARFLARLKELVEDGFELE